MDNDGRLSPEQSRRFLDAMFNNPFMRQMGFWERVRVGWLAFWTILRGGCVAVNMEVRGNLLLPAPPVLKLALGRSGRSVPRALLVNCIIPIPTNTTEEKA